MKNFFIHISLKYPKLIITGCVSAVIILAMFIPRITVDTDPENMLSEKEFVRVFHHEVKREFDLYDFIVLGIVNEHDPNGIFNKKSLTKIFNITRQISNIDGVIAHNIISPSTTDNIQQAGLGTVRFEWLMGQPPATEDSAHAIRIEAQDNPMLNGTLISEDGKALCIYIPIKEKNISYRVSQDVLKIIKKYEGNERYYITGLPVAEDTFGVQMFKQMAISAPLAGLIIFLLLLFSFRKISIILAPMIMAMMTVIATMGMLIGMGFTVHIMSSMIPIFLMPISVVDSVHILSEFYDLYPSIKDKRKTIAQVMRHLFAPMLYTSLTTIAGFISLAFTPIPPVQVFGVFVALGVLVAWIFTVTFIPAYTLLLPDRFLRNFGIKEHEQQSSLLARILDKTNTIALKYSKIIIAGIILLIAVSIVGITKTNVNDNPVKWFTKHHPIRIADTVLNQHFGGTYTAYLVLTSKDKQKEVFKQPGMLRWIGKLQIFLKQTADVGKSTTVSDVVKKVYSELMEGDKEFFRIPDTAPAVAQCLMSFQNSHKPDDLWHLVTPNYSKANIWIQLKSGDNRNMERVVRSVHSFIEKNPPPFAVTSNWAGLTYINTVWQDKMVRGMLKSLLGSFVIVFLMMTFLFSSMSWGALSMVPLSVTILFIYGLIGWVGKDYDMPTAVLSSLTLGLSVDFAIHFLERTRELYKKCGDWSTAAHELFGSSGRAITRNALVIAIGFTPLLLAPLNPYKTVGFFMMAIMFTSAVITLLVLPAILSVFHTRFFHYDQRGLLCKWCNCFFLLLIAVGGIVFSVSNGVAFNLSSTFIYITASVLIILAVVCMFLSRRTQCHKSKEGE